MSTIDTIQYKNTVTKNILSLCLDYYKSRKEYETESMAKTDIGVVLPELIQLCKDQFGKNIEYRSGNFYSHSQPYLPHTDYKTYQDNILNVVIPLEYTESLPSLVIFDQQWNLDSVTWSMHHKVQYFAVNVGVKGSPYEYPVTGLTNAPIDRIFYKEYLSHFPSQNLFGLSGTAYPFEPGSIIFFDNRKIHCTSSFTGTKTGVSLRFKINN